MRCCAMRDLGTLVRYLGWLRVFATNPSFGEGDQPGSPGRLAEAKSGLTPSKNSISWERNVVYEPVRQVSRSGSAKLFALFSDQQHALVLRQPSVSVLH
jgi:hypothetical protein